MRSREWIPLVAAFALTVGTVACEGVGPLAPSNSIEAGGEFETRAEVRGAVSSVNAAAGSFTLESGTRVRIDSETTFSAAGDLRSVAEVDSAIASGTRVRAEAHGTFEAGALIASTVKFESDADEEDEGEGEEPAGGDTTVEMDGIVESVNVASASFSLGGGTRVRLTASTKIEASGDLSSLAEVATALSLGQRVRAEADGTMEGSVVVASSVKFEVDGAADDDGDDAEADKDFVAVAGVDLSARTVTLVDGTTFEIGSDEPIDASGELTTLAQVDAALRAGLEVHARADLEVNLLGILVVQSVRFEIEGDVRADVEIEGRVEAVDLSARSVVVAGTTVHVATDSAIDASGDFRTLAEVEASVRAGVRVEAEARGTLTTSDGLLAAEARFKAKAEAG